MAKLIVALKDKSDIIFPHGHVSIAAPGVFVISDKEGADGTIIGMFPIPSVAGIYHPDGPDTVKLVEGRLLS